MTSHFKYFASQQADENVIIVTRKHIFVLFPVLLSVFLVYIIGLVVAFIVPGFIPMLLRAPVFNVFVAILSLYFLFATLFLFIAWLLHYLNIMVVTNEHIVEITQKNLFSRKIAEMDLENVQDVSSSEDGPIENIYHFGNVFVQTAGEAPNFDFGKVPNPNEIAQKIMELKEECIRSKYGGNRTLNAEGNFVGYNQGFSQPYQNPYQENENFGLSNPAGQANGNQGGHFQETNPYPPQYPESFRSPEQTEEPRDNFQNNA
ncbi:MAG: hypothetical protein M1355_00065 [Patescibacteria group bacterium]|nr:hypothetical protein [Patescibacteria group bacterium]